MQNLFAKNRFSAAECLLPAKECRLIETDTQNIRKMLTAYGKQLVSDAEKILDKPYRILDATVYMQFARNGNRSVFEDIYFERRHFVLIFTLAELYEGKGRFRDRIIDGLWHIMEESTWVLPAHNFNCCNNGKSPLPDAFFSADEGDDVRHIDLFSAATGAFIAVMWALTADILDSEAPVIRKRMLSQLKQRVLHPFYYYELDWWMGANGESLNNWTPWIISNILTVLGLCEDDDKKRAFAVDKCMTILDRFTLPYPSDGGCDEGPGYWSEAGASYFDCMEELYALSGGKIDLFGEELPHRMCGYIMDFCISDGTFINFSDASAHIKPDFRLISRMGRVMGIPELVSFASSAAHDEHLPYLDTSNPYRMMRNMTEIIQKSVGFKPKRHTYYPDLQVAISRESDPDGGLCLVFKGGHNAESHNHNDVGQFILFSGDFESSVPVIMDAGVETYCRDTFSENRYKLWAMRGNYHNIANIGGIEEQPGREYSAETVSYDAETGCMELELKNAYPSQAGVVSYRRRAALEEGRARVVDEFLFESAKKIELHYITIDRPKIEGDTISFASGEKAKFDVSLRATAEEIYLADGKISREWKRGSLWRITLATDVPVKEAHYILEFSKK